MAVVRLYANLRKLAGAKELRVSGATLRATLDDLIRQQALLGPVLLDGGELRPHVIVTVNGQNLVTRDAPLAPDDIIAIFPPMAGGSLALVRNPLVSGDQEK